MGVVAAQDDQPVFNFDRFSWKDAKTITRIQAEAARAAALLADPAALKDEDAFEGALAAQDAVYEKLQAYISRVLVSVPRSWLVSDAPEDLDWSDPASLDWLRGQSFAKLQGAMVDASTPESVSGN